MQSSAAFFGGRGGRSDYFFASEIRKFVTTGKYPQHIAQLNPRAPLLC
jgi:hypothetical protein